MRTMRLSVPGDFDLKRDACSYGYIVLAPNYWDTKSHTLWRVLTLDGGPALVSIAQEGRRGSPLKVGVSRALDKVDKAELTAQLTRMLRLDETREHIREFHRLDKRFRGSGRGRVLRSPTLFEDVIKTITSCNVTWPGTVQMNRRLCEVLGDKVAMPRGVDVPQAYAFPTARQVARARPETLRARCRVGYRDARIIEIARLFSMPAAKGGLDVARLENPATPDEDLHEMLLELPGVGPYAAANIMQLLGRYGRVPCDTESVRHGRSVLKFRGSSAQVMKKVKAHFAPFGAHAFRSYWFEMWNFYESKHGPAWTWERESTGKLFTAALLSK